MSTKVKSPENLPNKPGVYIMRNKQDEIIYIGKVRQKTSLKELDLIFAQFLTGLKPKY